VAAAGRRKRRRTESEGLELFAFSEREGQNPSLKADLAARGRWLVSRFTWAGLYFSGSVAANFRCKPITKIIQYFLRSIILFANIDIFRHILLIDTFVFVKNNMDRREYYILEYFTDEK
jgi:hypothetical protein